MIVAVDTETTGLNPYLGARPFAMSTKGTKDVAPYIVLGEDDIIPASLMLLSSNYDKVFHNAKFDIQMLQAANMEVNGVINDTMIMAAVYNPDETSKALKRLAEKYLGVEATEEKALKDYMRKHKLDKEFIKVPREIMEPYALKDVEYTMGLYEFYKEKGVLDNPIYKLEMKLMHVLIAMQQRGAQLDIPYLVAQKTLCEHELASLNAKIKLEYGDINVSSNKQLGKFLFDDEKLQCDAYSAAGNPSLDIYNLQKYDHPIIPLVTRMRDLTKCLNTYVMGLIDGADKEGAIHCDFFQVGAKTGRFSCRQPNLQNIPRGGSVDIRRAFTCRPDYTNYYFDYSQIELRILAHYSKEQKMIDELSLADGDLHGMTAELIFGEDFTKEQRDIAKKINFGIVYGIGPKHFCEVLNREYPESNYTYTSAKSFIDRYYHNYYEVRKFTWNVPRRILEVGYVQDVFGRKYTCDKSMTYKSVNYLIQGCAAGVLKDAMIRVHSLLRGTKSNILLTIHDEIVIEIHKDEEVLVKQIKKMMEDYKTFRVPITCNISKTSTNWSEKD